MRFAALMMLLGLVACESDSTGGEGGSDADRADPTGAPFEENPVIFELSGAPFGEGWQETEEVSTQVSVTVLDPIPELEVSAWGYFVEGEYDFDCGVAFQVKNVSEVAQCDIELSQFRALQGEGLLGTDADSRIIVFGSVGFTEDETPSNCLAPGETGWAVGELWHLILDECITASAVEIGQVTSSAEAQLSSGVAVTASSYEVSGSIETIVVHLENPGDEDRDVSVILAVLDDAGDVVAVYDDSYETTVPAGESIFVDGWSMYDLSVSASRLRVLLTYPREF